MTWLRWWLRGWLLRFSVGHVEWLAQCNPGDPELQKLTERHRKRLRNWECQEPL